MKYFASQTGLRRIFVLLCVGFFVVSSSFFVRYYVVKKPFGLSAACFTVYKKLGMLGWQTKKSLYYDGYLRDLLAVYRSPFFAEEEKFADSIKAGHIENQKVVFERFAQDQQKIAASTLYHLGLLKPANDQIYDVTDSNVLSRLKERYAGNAKQAQHMLAVLDCLILPQKEQLLKTHFDFKDVIVARDVQTRSLAEKQISGFERDRIMIMGIILDTVIKKDLVPRFYDYDYLDEIEIIAESVYTLYQEAGSIRGQRFLQALNLLTDNDHVSGQKLGQKIKHFLGLQHPYIPLRMATEPGLKNANPAVYDVLSGLKAEDNMQKFLDANTKYSGDQLKKQGKTDSRQLSLLRGYEKNHHVLLRTIIKLMQEGKLTKNDEVLIIGPRYVNEILFFREHLGLPKTIGLDLCANDYIVVGDMHAMPFENNRFKLVYVCNTLCYSYYVRKVADEISRVLKRTGYACIVDHGTYVEGASMIGRSDVMNADALVGLFYKQTFNVLAQDNGVPLASYKSKNQASCVLELC